MHVTTPSVKGEVSAVNLGSVDEDAIVQTWISLSALMQSLGLSSPLLDISLNNSMLFGSWCSSSGIAGLKIFFMALKPYASSSSLFAR
jgi:hypothetical protein